MKRIVAVILAVVMVVSVSACGKADSDGTKAADKKENYSKVDIKENDEPSYELVKINGGTFYNLFGEPCVSAYAEIKNNSAYPIRLTNTYLDYEDSEGNLISSDQYVDCIPNVILPGECGYIYSGYHSLEGVDKSRIDGTINVIAHGGAVEASNFVALPVSDIVVNTSDQIFNVIITARALNDTGEDLSLVKTSAIFYDASGEPIGFCYGFDEMPDGQKTTFEINGDVMSTDFKQSDVASVQVFAQRDIY